MNYATHQPISLTLPSILAKAEVDNGKRIIYFETSRQGTQDREGEDIAADSLWNSKELFLEQGDLDLSHWSKLGNPPGTGARPEYIIGQPIDVERDGASIYVKGEIFNPTTSPFEGSQGYHANMFWHSLTQQNPAGRWYPSVFGFVKSKNIKRGEGSILSGKIDWTSVGFAQRVQHPELPNIGTEPVGPFANVGNGELLQMSLATFSKAVQTAGDAVALDDKVGLEGVAAIRNEKLEPQAKALSEDLYRQARSKVLELLMSGQSKPTLESVALAFAASGIPVEHIHECAKRLNEQGKALKP